MSSESSVYDVIIIGCGPAGIAAAIDFEKSERKINYVILEARDRVGGRVITDRSVFGEDVPVDLGAQWLHHYRPENPLYPYQPLDENPQVNHHFIFRSETTPFFDIDGTRFSTEQINRAEEIFNDLCRRIQQASWTTDQSMWDVIKTDYHQYEQDPPLKRLLDLFFGIIEQYEASNLDQLSAKSYLQSDSGIEEFNLAIPPGFGTLIKRIAEQHHLPVQLNAVVTRIDASSISTTDCVRIDTADHRSFQSRFVLITVPLGCLKRSTIEFIPPLPDWKQKAIDQMGFGVSDKIFIQFPSVFWDPSWPVFITTSPKFRFILCQARSALVLVKLCANVAIDLEKKSDQEIIDEVMEFFRTIFPDRDVPSPIRCLITRWNQDRFAYGSYSNFAVGTDTETLVDLARECHERIYWAGEHTNYGGTIGCVDSAFESGQREGKRLVERVNK